MRRLIDYINTVEHAAASATDVRIDPTQTVNDAGRHLISMHGWGFLERPPVAIDLVADTNFAVLPADLDQILVVDVPQGIQTSAELTSIDQIMYMRSTPWIDTFNYYVAIEYPTQTDATSAPIGPRLAVYPTPGTDLEGALTIHYRAGWVELSDLNAVANIPTDFEPLMVALCRAFSLGYADEQRGRGSAIDRIEAIERSSMVARLKDKDGSDQWNLGRHQGGMLQHGGTGEFRPQRSIRFEGGS